MPTATANNWQQYAPQKAFAPPASWVAKDTATRAAMAPPPAAVSSVAVDSPYMNAPGTELPNSPAALAQMRDLQTQALGGLQGLMTRDTTAKRKALEDAMFASSEEAITRASDRERMKMLEGTFGRGVGSSTITLNLADQLGQNTKDALARASREAFINAGAEDRADLQTELARLNAGFGAGTTGMQAEHNIIQKVLDRQQQESQFGRNIAFQQGEGAANRGLTSTLAGQDLAFRNQQLAQQNAQFNQNLGFLGSENAANRAHQTGMLGQQQTFMGGENAANRALQQALAQMGFDFQGSQNALNRDFTGGQNQASRDLQMQLAQMGFDFTGGQNALNRDFTASQSQLGRDFSMTQNQANRDAQLQQLLLQLENSQDINSGNLLAGGVAGAGSLLGRILQGYLL